ncbi:AMP-binding protein [uncultured Sphingomonas sp.]|uniref:AMP-binding protein n=1 Tax=uncultured Sphingomonas sp. TaxID=158754 RepID=UPI0035CBE0EC
MGGDTVVMTGPSAAGRRLIAGRHVRWDDARACAAYADGWWTSETLADALDRATRDTPERIVLIDGAVRIDCRTLHRDAAALAAAMLARIEPGSVVSFMLPNWHEAATIYLAATLAGMVAHPILPVLRETDLAFMLPDVRSRMIFVPATFRGRDFPAMVERACAGVADPPLLVAVRGEGGVGLAYEALVAATNPSAPPALEADAVRMILYTSGTTGVPKGVMHSHNSLHALARQLGEHWLIEPGDTFLVPSPISHIGGSIYAFELPLLCGTAAVLMDRWDPDAAVALIGEHRCTHMAGATPFLEQLLAAAQAAGDRLASLKLFICGGAAVPPTLVQAATGWFARAVVTRVYGSTEVPVITVGTIDRTDPEHAAETDGRRGIAEVRLTSHHAAVEANAGEVHARGPQMLVGYVHAEDEASVFDADGFYRTGDLGRWIDDDFLVITGRAKDIIIRNGENISPKEIEDLLAGHPGVAEIAVVGVPDPRTGERACAVVVASARDFDPASVVVFLKGLGVAGFKLPEQVVVWDSLPRNAAGKVLKHEIRATLTMGGD